VIDERARRRVVRVAGVGIVLMVAYWTAWYGHRDLVASNTTRAYYDFENAFPLPDAWVTVCLAGAAWSLRRHSPVALFWLLAGGGAGMYLFAIDTLYDIEHNVWFTSGGGGYVELAINLITLVVSAGLLRWAWRNRAPLLGGE